MFYKLMHKFHINESSVHLDDGIHSWITDYDPWYIHIAIFELVNMVKVFIHDPMFTQLIQ